MRILHTSDWHVGKVLKGKNRTEEHIRVLAQVVDIARAERPDLVIVAGDLYDTAAPTAEATRLVTRALSALRKTGARVVAIGGNHDNGAALDALRPWADAAGIELRGSYPKGDLNDLLIEGTTEGGERWRLVALPFLSQRYAIRAAEMYELTAAEANQTYADLMARLIAKISAPFDEPGVVNLLTAHLTIVGATTGGGEREAHTIMGYAVPATVFPPNAHYVALGHLHRTQSVISPCPTRYSGSPLAVDFGEEENVCSVAIVDVSAEKAAHVRDVPVTSALTLRTVRGTLEQLATVNLPDAWLRVLVREAPRPGLREDVQELLPNALEVRIDPDMLPKSSGARSAERAGRSPRELFGDYLDSRGNAEEGVRELFDQLYDEVSSNK
ncbi:nuclease SbcCD subunit D [Actinoplanes italicus]|uniref:Nuclease SbcCD subunit D n=1 Tax=Actinoplanes italicus TaxID=113567 RepID=A0A2T0KEI1_9ACTN|nr:exonuclease SbcCD subunit D [Actinoplanes italicus]PRX21407.1 exodeoxyribonuclease I subunit D [Actinoplanes italicus]GIE27085.1 nuclease SbcCD subunit D [Actinoplanes italicus]